jgi:hypothetical protein
VARTNKRCRYPVAVLLCLSPPRQVDDGCCMLLRQSADKPGSDECRAEGAVRLSSVAGSSGLLVEWVCGLLMDPVRE